MAVGGPAFSSVRRARELLREKSIEIYEKYEKLAAMAASNGDFETAEKIYRYLLDHTTDEDGTSLLSPGVDVKAKQLTESAPKGPSITIGVAIGGLGQKSLPEAAPVIEVIDVSPERIDDK